jgi:hypothetical protein
MRGLGDGEKRRRGDFFDNGRRKAYGTREAAEGGICFEFKGVSLEPQITKKALTIH